MNRNDDWAPGDLALCVRSGNVICDCGGHHEHGGAWCPGRGAVREVSRVEPIAENWLGHFCGSGVLFFVDGTAGLQLRFRKIRPHTPDAEDAETIRLLNGTPVREPVA